MAVQTVCRMAPPCRGWKPWPASRSAFPRPDSLPDGTAVPRLEAVASLAKRIPSSGQYAGWHRCTGAGSRDQLRAAHSPVRTVCRMAPPCRGCKPWSASRRPSGLTVGKRPKLRGWQCQEDIKYETLHRVSYPMSRHSHRDASLY